MMPTVDRAIPGRVSYSSSSHTASLDPTPPLQKRTAYVVEFKAGIRDASGNALQLPSWPFTTGGWTESAAGRGPASPAWRGGILPRVPDDLIA